MASSKSPLGLPPLTPELKSIVPFLQRAEEVKATEPVVAYWCAYYAAQLGISLKTKDSTSRNVLVGLLGFLEQMKSEIGVNEAVQVEAVGSAYVENFGLKVFTAADNEDRAGRASRSTAKKFLAAANFLETLKTFSSIDISESNLEKIKYAKWKATDIAKAFREGRKPIPGPPGWAEEREVANQLTALEPGPSDSHSLSLPSAPTKSASSGRVSPERSPPPRARSKSPTSDSTKSTSTSPRYHDGDWSTTAVPNTSVLNITPPSAPGPPVHRRSSSGRSSPKRAQGSAKRGAYVFR
ncbi:DUF605-domain-containing protein [Coprinellus micaceus]|uniref:DUF605-domain-containing protein n=1 Tax=Coprinellus micaceus TaxID=71717 RepID=A0A4Y7TY20_COPMI|nr:DUF605-domain-containing protein [Coprinellus micaceus]